MLFTLSVIELTFSVTTRFSFLSFAAYYYAGCWIVGKQNTNSLSLSRFPFINSWWLMVVSAQLSMQKNDKNNTIIFIFPVSLFLSLSLFFYFCTRVYVTRRHHFDDDLIFCSCGLLVPMFFFDCSGRCGRRLTTTRVCRQIKSSHVSSVTMKMSKLYVVFRQRSISHGHHSFVETFFFSVPLALPCDVPTTTISTR